jgi:transcriptional regulator with XRE-family HTH domain
MTELPETMGEIPEWTLGWRLQRSLSHAGIGVEEMADEMGVSRSTVGRWLNDRGAAPKAAYLKMWALRTGVPFAWLADTDPTGRGGSKISRETSKAQRGGGFISGLSSGLHLSRTLHHVA